MFESESLVSLLFYVKVQGIQGTVKRSRCSCAMSLNFVTAGDFGMFATLKGWETEHNKQVFTACLATTSTGVHA